MPSPMSMQLPMLASWSSYTELQFDLCGLSQDSLLSVPHLYEAGQSNVRFRYIKPACVWLINEDPTGSSCRFRHV
jgi:hypothetical protein